MLLTKPSQVWRHFTVVGEPFTQTLKGDESEDRVLVRQDGAGVIVVDGATSKSGDRLKGHTDGWWAAEMAMREFALLDHQATVHEFVLKVHKTLRQIHASNPTLHPHAVFAAYWAPRHEVWWVGDCIAIEVSPAGMAAYTHTDAIAPDAVSIAMRNAMFDQMKDKPYTAAEKARLARDVVWPFIQNQLQYANREDNHPLAYGVLAETQTPTRFVHAVSVDPESRGVILASDGLPQIAGYKDAMLAFLKLFRSINPQLVANPQFPGAVKGFVDPETGELRDLYDDTTIVEIVFDKAPV